eukprot:6174660-Pleurochrysis_carterae.AAC.7
MHAHPYTHQHEHALRAIFPPFETHHSTPLHPCARTHGHAHAQTNQQLCAHALLDVSKARTRAHERGTVRQTLREMRFQDVLFSTYFCERYTRSP